MALPGTRMQMSWFFIPVVPATRFLQNNFPNETTFRNLVSSVAFILNSEDTADVAQTQQGLVAKALAADIVAALDTKDIGIGGNVALSVSPAQLPIVAIASGTQPVVTQNGAGAQVYTFPAYLLSNQGDVVITGPASGQGLLYNGTHWVNTNMGYQRVASNLNLVTQRNILNFSTKFTVTDDNVNLNSTIEIANGAITYVKMQNAVGGNVLLGNSTGAGGVYSEQTVSARLSLTGSVLDIASHGVTYAYMQNTSQGNVLLGNSTGAAGAIAEITLGADHVFSGGTLVLATNGVTYAKIQQTAGSTVLIGNIGGAPGNVGEVNIKGLYANISTNTLQSWTLKTVSTTNYTALVSDFNGGIIGFTYTPTGVVSVTMPNPATITPGLKIYFKDLGGSAATHNITINPFNTEKIDGASTNVISTNYGKVALMTDGTNWFTI